ncbi:MAG: DUF429 domain-containing protein [Chloroflexi bacterium]|nr:DUF429 domain-containing protein [Chloroflexota bacterium]
MLFTDSVFIGITPASERKLFVYAVLDRELKLVSLADGEMGDVTAFIAGQDSAAVAVNAPSGVNRGLVREMVKSKMLTPYQLRRTELRLAEHELREHGIFVTKTHASAELCPAWMQAGFSLHRKLGKMGFQKYPEGDSKRLVLETNSQACYSLMGGQVPLARLSLEGRLQRQLILYEHGLDIRDPMDFFEEITRYKIIKGILPMELLYQPDQLDALVAAYIAWLAAYKQEGVFEIGDSKEGMVVLPGKGLKEKY